MITVITPWLNHEEFALPFAQAVQGADEVLIVDTGSDSAVAEARDAVLKTCGMPFRVLRYEGEPTTYGGWCNFGLKEAQPGVVVFANNDISGQGQVWTSMFRQGVVQSKMLVGPSLQARLLAGAGLAYVEGWFVAADTATWEMLSSTEFDFAGPWNTRDYEPPGYYEDNDLSLRATMLGIRLVHLPVPLRHLNNGTTRLVARAFDASDRNRLRLDKAVREWGMSLIGRAS